MSQDEIQKFICEQLTELNNKQDKGEQTLGELKVAIEDSTVTAKRLYKLLNNFLLRTKL